MNLDEVLHGNNGQPEEQIDDDLLNDQPLDEPTEPQGATPLAEPPAATPQTEPDHVPKAALLDERNKRQKLEKQAQELQRRIEEMQRQSQSQQPQPSFDENPDEYVKLLERKLEQRLFNTRLDDLEERAREKYGDADFEAKVEKFQEMMQATPGLQQQWQAAKNPAEFVYQTAKHRMELDEVGGSIDTYKSKIEADLRAKIKAEIEADFKKKEEEKAKLKASLPSSISDSNSSAPRASAYTGPTPLNAIIKRKK